MTVFRTTDLLRWGAGKGSNLTPTEVDRNFWDILERVVTLEDDPVAPVGIASITTTANTFTVHLTNGSTQGPFSLPVAEFNLLGEWIPLHNYSANVGSFITEGGNTYIIQFAHTSAATFDPGANDGLGHNYYGLLPFPNAPIIEFLDDGWPPLTALGAYKLFSVPDVGVFLSLRAHTTAATFDPDALLGGLPLYQEVFGAIETNRARIQFQFAGAAPSDASIIMVYIQDDARDLSFPENFVGSAAHLNVACTATIEWTIEYAGDVIGTITFAPGELLDGDGGQFGTLSGDGVAAIANLELLRLRSPGAADATAKFLTISLVGTYVE